MNTQVFYHIGMVGDWTPLVDRQLKRLKSSGLYPNASINIGFVTDGSYHDEFGKLCDLLRDNGMEDNISLVSNNGQKLNQYEYNTMRALAQFAFTDNTDARIMYMHNKGSTRGAAQNILDWVELLEYFTIDKWKEAIMELNNNDVYGVNYKSQDSNPAHFSGNFWWSKSSWIKNLDITKITLENRYSAEMWVCSTPNHRVACPFNDANIDHYRDLCPPSLYKDKPLPTISTVISYSVNDKQFLKECIEHAKSFSEEIVVSFCDHFFDGVPCNEIELNESTEIIKSLGAIPVVFKYDKSINPMNGTEYESRWWNNQQRFLAYKQLSKKSEWILWLDADEIVDTQNFVEWITVGNIDRCDSYSLSNYWYWRNVFTRATHIESNTIFTKSRLINDSVFFKNPAIERENFLGGAQEYCKKGVFDSILIHHYSWVRTKEQMLQKVSSWSHNKDEITLGRARAVSNAPSSYGWKDLVNLEFQHEPTNKDFVHGYNLIQTEPYISL